MKNCSSSRNLKSGMSYILRQMSAGSIQNQVNPTTSAPTSPPHPPQQQQHHGPPSSRPLSRPPPKLYVSAAASSSLSPPPSALSPFPLTPLIAEVEQEKLSNDNLPDVIKGLESAIQSCVQGREAK